MPPLLIAELIVCSGQLKDQAAVDHTLSLFSNYRDGCLNYRAWSTTERRWVEQTGAEMTCVSHRFFTDAITFLRNAHTQAKAWSTRGGISRDFDGVWYRATHA